MRFPTAIDAELKESTIAELRRVVADMLPYLRHDDQCKRHDLKRDYGTERGWCSCGLDALLKRVRPAGRPVVFPMRRPVR
jgi:hypothetical protein